MKSILLISPEAWGNNHVSKHHYAKELAKNGYKVYFLNPPSKIKQCTKISENLYLIDYKIRVKGIAKLPPFFSAFLIKRDINFLEKLAKDRFDTIWNFDSSRFFNLSTLKNKTRICHIVDMAENIQRDLLAKTSDICFCTSNFIAAELKPFNSKVFKINHGYQIQKDDFTLEESFSKNKIKIGYVGNLTRSCIDWKLLFYLIEKYTEVAFYFIGSYKASNLARNNIAHEVLEKLQGYHNVYLLGSKPSHLIPTYLKKFDILLSAYIIESEDDVKQHSNLHKTLEYIGSGKVILTTYTEEYKDKDNLLVMTKNKNEFLSKFEEIKLNLDHYNSAELQRSRVEYANENSYKNQLIKILSLLKSHLEL